MGKLNRVICILSVFILSAGMLAGCALFERNMQVYNNLPVATVGNITITKKQLVDGFNNFGYQYEQNEGHTREEALEETLTLLIDREVMVNLALEQFYGWTEAEITAARKDVWFPYNLMVPKDKKTEYFPYTEVTTKEQDSARKAAFTSLNSWYKQLEDEARKSYGLSVETTDKEDESSTDDKVHDTYTPFTPLLTPYNIEKERIVQNGLTATKEKYWETTYRLDVSQYAEEKNVGVVAKTWTRNSRVSDPTDTELKIAESAYGSLVLRLKNNEMGLTFEEDKDKKSPEVNQNVIAREVRRMAVEEAKNSVIKKFSDAFAQGLDKEIDRSPSAEYNGVPYATLVAAYGEQGAYEYAVSSLNSDYTKDLALRAGEYYKRQVRNQIDKYRKQQETDSSIGTKLLDSLSEVYFAPESIINQYFSVSHILIGYSDEQKKELEQIEARYKTSGNKTDYETSLNALRARTGGYMREDGKEVGKFMTAEEILEFIQGYVMPYEKKNDKAYTAGATDDGYVRDIQEILRAFRDCIYMFNTDPGMVNPQFEYVIGINESRMVESFNEASRALYWNFDTNRQEGKPGGMSGLVWSEFGAHIIMYTRPLTDFIYHNSLSVLDSTFGTFLNATQTSYGEKKYFDAIVETLTKPEYETQEQNLIAGYLEGKTITTIKRNFSDLFK